MSQATAVQLPAMANLSNTLPARLVAGTSLEFLRALPDYPAPAWTLAYALVRPGHGYTFSSADGGDGAHLVSVAPATTAAWTPGAYQWQETVSDGAARFTLRHGTLLVEPDFATLAGGHDGRSHARKCLDAIEAQLEGRATEDQKQIEFPFVGGGTQRLENFPLSDLLKFRGYYRDEVAREEAAQAGKPGRGIIRVRF